VAAALCTHRDYIMAEVLAVELTVGPVAGDGHTLDIDGQPVRVAISRA
jgi:hypothetical protein